MGLPITSHRNDLQNINSIFEVEGGYCNTKFNAQTFLGLDDLQAATLFNPEHTLKDLEYLVDCYLK